MHLPPDQRRRPSGTYGKLEHEQEGQRRIDAGYARLLHPRARSSEGEWQPLGSTLDGHDAVEWVPPRVVQRAVGAEGLSYDGWIDGDGQPAAAAPEGGDPVLRRRWRRKSYQHGCFQLFFVWWWARCGGGSWNSRMPRRLDCCRSRPPASDQPGGARLARVHGARDARRALAGAALGRRSLRRPCLHVTGWHDREDLTGAFHHYEEMIASSPARDRQWLLVGPWTHVSTRCPDTAGAYPDAALDMTAIELRFFDHFLKGGTTGRAAVSTPGAGQWKVGPPGRAVPASRRSSSAPAGGCSRRRAPTARTSTATTR
ncbi:MAG: CocE/NonD family hydrolase [Solirubrobacterales bacterium]